MGGRTNGGGKLKTRRSFPGRPAEKRFFPLPNELFILDLSPGEIAVYAYLMFCEDRDTYQCWPSYQTIGQRTGMSPNTVRKYGVTYNAEALIRYMEQAMNVPEPPPVPVWTESKQRQREALKKLAHGQWLENIESFEEDEGYSFGMSM